MRAGSTRLAEHHETKNHDPRLVFTWWASLHQRARELNPSTTLCTYHPRRAACTRPQSVFPAADLYHRGFWGGTRHATGRQNNRQARHATGKAEQQGMQGRPGKHTVQKAGTHIHTYTHRPRRDPSVISEIPSWPGRGLHPSLLWGQGIQPRGQGQWREAPQETCKRQTGVPSQPRRGAGRAQGTRPRPPHPILLWGQGIQPRGLSNPPKTSHPRSRWGGLPAPKAPQIQ